MSANGDVGLEQTEEKFDASLADVLRGGVVFSAAVILCGAVVFLVKHGTEEPDYHVFHGAAAPLRSIDGVILEAVRLSGAGLIQLGVLLLIATPIARVVLSIVGFLRARDRLYVGITILVLALLIYSVTNG